MSGRRSPPVSRVVSHASWGVDDRSHVVGGWVRRALCAPGPGSLLDGVLAVRPEALVGTVSGRDQVCEAHAAFRT